MKVAAAFAVLVLGTAAVVAAVARSAAAPAACTAPSPVADPGHGFELHMLAKPVDIEDAQHRVDDAIPGADAGNFVNIGGHQVDIWDGHTGSYVLRAVGSAGFPTELSLERMAWQGPDQMWEPVEIAFWIVTRPLPHTPLELAFSTGEPLQGVRLCVAGAPLAPSSVVSGPLSREETAPRVGESVVALAHGRDQVTLAASDEGSGLVGLWTYVTPGPFRMVRYTGPLVVKRGGTVNYWAIDRADNENDGAVKAR